MNIASRSYIRIITPLLLGLPVLCVPLLRDFHLESAILVSVTGCFWAAWKATNPSAKKEKDVQAASHILGYLYLFGIPLLIYTLMTGCFSVHGLGFWLLYPAPSVFLGYASGRLFRLWRIPYGRILATAILLGIAVGVLLIEFLSFPQVYFFNHVWGGWPGPIYDETVRLSASIFFFRALTILWILLLWFVPAYARDNHARWIVWLTAIALGFGYTQLTEMGIISPESYLQQRLGGFRKTDHFRIYFDRRHYSGDEIGLIALEHEFYLEEVTDTLELAKPDPGNKIRSYLYAHPWQKKELTGAKFTSYVPVWLEGDQLHIAKQQITSSLKHELVHVLSKQFGNTLFNASWSIGLVEGIAVALAPKVSSSSTIDQIVASDKPYPTTVQMQRALSPLGFYGGRSPVNYTTTGSFVRYLVEEYPATFFKRAYQAGSIESAYPVSFRSLVQGWHQQLDAVPTDSVDRQVSQRLFGIPSLFEQRCPHITSDFAQARDRYEYYLADGDTARALAHLDDAQMYSSGSEAIKAEWVYRNLKAGNIEKVQAEATTADSSVDLRLLYADAFALAGEGDAAAVYLHEAAARLNLHPDSSLDAALATRMEPQQWQYYRQLTYGDQLFTVDAFSALYYRTKIRAIEQVIQAERSSLLSDYARQLLAQPAHSIYFDEYIAMIHRLGYYGAWDIAESWFSKLRSMPLRERHKERLQEEWRWVRYLKTKS